MRAYRIAYDGRGYHGFQRQPDVPTVEDAIFDALRALDVFEGDDPPGYAAAGRTDAGVSALAQTVAFDAPEWLIPRALDSALPGDVRAWASADAPAGFHATHDAVAREYEYHLHVGTTRDGVSEVVVERARTALERLTGDRDFHNLTPDESATERELSTDLRVEGAVVVLTFRAGGFPRQLVRRAASLVREVAVGEAGIERIERALDEEPLSGPEGIAPAPPYPLLLTDVTYPRLTFEVDPDAADAALRAFSDRRIELATRARVAGRIADGVRRD